jgi:hypothetical protein
MNAKPTEQFRILKVGTCPSLTLASQITYRLGLNVEQVYLAIAGNSGGGLYSKEYVSLEAIIAVIMAQGDQPITGKTLRPLFKGKSANTPGFALAAARDLGLIVAKPGEEGGYQRGDAQRCREEIAALITAGTAILVAAHSISCPSDLGNTSRGIPQDWVYRSLTPSNTRSGVRI